MGYQASTMLVVGIKLKTVRGKIRKTRYDQFTGKPHEIAIDGEPTVTICGETYDCSDCLEGIDINGLSILETSTDYDFSDYYLGVEIEEEEVPAEEISSVFNEVGEALVSLEIEEEPKMFVLLYESA